MADFTIKKNDTAPAIRGVLYDRDDNVVDLTGCTVRFLMSNLVNDGGELSVGSNVVTGDAAIIDEVNGIVEYQWVAGDTDTAGEYYCEWEVTYGSDNTVETFPSDGYNTITIKTDLA